MNCLRAPRCLARALALFPALLLAACATRPLVLDDPDWRRHEASVTALENWELTGRLNVKQHAQSDTVQLNWMQRQETFDLRLGSSLLGLGAVHVHGIPTRVTVEKAGEAPATLPGLDAVTQQYFGYDFPTAQLLYWVRGLPAPGLGGSSTFDANRMLATLRQVDASGLEWHLQFDRYLELDGGAGMVYLPGRIRAERAGLQLTFLVSAWQVPQTTDAP